MAVAKSTNSALRLSRDGPPLAQRAMVGRGVVPPVTAPIGANRELGCTLRVGCTGALEALRHDALPALHQSANGLREGGRCEGGQHPDFP